MSTRSGLWTPAAALATLGASIYLAAAPTVIVEGRSLEREETLIAHEGAWVLLILAIPVAIAGAGLAALALASPARRRALWAGALAMVLFALVTGFSVGLAYWPAAILLLIGARATARTRDLGDRST